MKAIVYHDYGSADVLRLEETEDPRPQDDEVLIKVRAASVNPLDWRLIKGKPYFIRMMARLVKLKTGRPGVDVAGEVQAVGRNVTQFTVGEAVFGACSGAFAEYACAPQSGLASKPKDISFEQAASINVAAMTALQALRNKGRIGPGQKVLINGAAGGVGTFAIQIAKAFGAEVTGVCSTRNLDLVRSLGADHVIDYTKEDFTKGTERYDVIFEGVGNLSFSACRRVLKRAGKFVIVGAHGSSAIGLMSWLIKAMVLSLFVSEKAIMFLASPNQQDLAIMSEWISSGKVTPVIDKCYKLSEVPEAVRYLEQGHARGKVVISLT